MGFVSAHEIGNAPSGTFLSMEDVEGKRASRIDWSIEGTYSGDIPVISPRALAEGALRAGAELPLFPVRAVGELAAASAGRPYSIEGAVGEGGQTDTDMQKRISGLFQGAVDTAKEMFLGAEAGAIAIEEGLSIPFAVIGMGPQAAGKWVEEKTGDPLIGKAVEYGSLIGLFKAGQLGGKGYKSREAITQSIRDRIESVRGRFRKAKPEGEGEFVSAEEVKGTPSVEVPPAGTGMFIPAEQVEFPSPEKGLFPKEKTFGLVSEEAPEAAKPFVPAPAEQPLLTGTEKAYRDVGMAEKSADPMLGQVDSLRSILPDFELGKKVWGEGGLKVIGNTPNMYPPWFKEVFRNDSAKEVMRVIDKWQDKGDSSLTKKETRIIASVKDLAKESADLGVDIAQEYWRGMMPEGSLSDAINAAIPETIPTVGLSVRPVDVTIPKPSFTEVDLKFRDATTETRYTEAHGLKPTPMWSRVKDTVETLKNKATREYEHLPRTAEFAPLRYKLLELAKQKGVASDRSVRAMQGITIKLDPIRMGLFERKVLLDDLVGEVGKGHDLPFGFAPESLGAEKARIDALSMSDPVVMEALAKRTAFSEGVRKEYVGAMKDVGLDVEGRFDNAAYFRHQVLEYANLKAVTGTGKQLRTPTGRGFLKERKGSELDINTNYLEAEHEVTAQMLYDIEVARTIKLVDEKYNVAGKLVDENIPAGYVKWQPREGNVFYLTDTIPARLAEKLKSDALEEIGITEKDLGNALAMGGPRKQFIVPTEVAETLNNMTRQKPQGTLLGLDKKALGAWKVWQLVSPRRYLKYNFRNLTGDADAAFVGNPSTFSKTPQAVRELYQVFKADRGMTPEMREWFKRGGFETTLQAQELHELNRFDTFKHIRDQKESITTLPVRVFKAYWKKATISTNFRESVLRYSAYLDYLDQMKKNPDGMPKNFGASMPEEIRALTDIRDRAFALSNQLLGAYDQVSVMGNSLRDHVYPFWSWKEVNFKRYIQFSKNAAADDILAKTAGRKVIGTAANPMTYVRVGSFLLKATALWSMLQTWNHLMFPQEERELDINTRNRPHIILGRDRDGKIINFTNIGALGDFLSWFGLDAFPLHISNWMQGKRSLREIAVEMAKSPVNVAVQGTIPGIKLTGELLTGKRLFPDAFRPAQIRDRGYHIAQSVGLENEYKALVGLPSEGYNKSLQNLFVYRSDPGQNAFSDILDEKSRFLEKIGKAGYGSFISPKSNALYNLRLAIKYRDQDAVKKFSEEYEKLGGTRKGLFTSLRNMHPLHGLNDREKIAFVMGLTKEDQGKLVRAIHFYTNVLVGQANK